MSLRQRGQEITIRIAIDSTVQAGSFFKIQEWTTTPRTDLVEEEYRVSLLRLGQPLHDPSGIGSHIGPTVPTDVRLVIRDVDQENRVRQCIENCHPLIPEG